MNKIIKTSLTLFCLLFSITVFGQKLTIEQCRAMALENNKRIAIAQQDKERADLIADATKTNFLPKVSVEGLAYYDNAKTNMKLGLGNLAIWI